MGEPRAWIHEREAGLKAHLVEKRRRRPARVLAVARALEMTTEDERCEWLRANTCQSREAR